LRLLQLSSVKFIIQSSPYTNPDPTVTDGAEPLKLVCCGTPIIYEYDGALPRAAVYRRVDLVNSDRNVLRKLTDPAFDPTKGAVVNASGLSSDQRAAIDAINRQDVQPVTAAKIIRYQSADVMVDAASAQPALLVINDSDYPGWKAELDGKPAKWITANYLFRGILIPGGDHTILFQYKPLSFHFGALIRGLTALLVVLNYFPVHRMKTAATMPPATGPKIGTHA
jgi:hypothetical protein